METLVVEAPRAPRAGQNGRSRPQLRGGPRRAIQCEKTPVREECKTDFPHVMNADDIDDDEVILDFSNTFASRVLGAAMTMEVESDEDEVFVEAAEIDDELQQIMAAAGLPTGTTVPWNGLPSVGTQALPSPKITLQGAAEELGAPAQPVASKPVVPLRHRASVASWMILKPRASPPSAAFVGCAEPAAPCVVAPAPADRGPVVVDPKGAVGFAWEALVSEDQEAPSWDELDIKDGTWVPQKPVEVERLPGVVWESLSLDADDMFETCVPKQQNRIDQPAANAPAVVASTEAHRDATVVEPKCPMGFAWEALACDDEEAPSWDELGNQDGTWVPQKPVEVERLPGVVWESISLDADDMFETCVPKQQNRIDQTAANAPAVVASTEAHRDATVVEPKCPMGFAWEALACDDEEAPSWDELGNQDGTWVPQKPVEVERLHGVVWESLSLDADDVLETCVPREQANSAPASAAKALAVEHRASVHVQAAPPAKPVPARRRPATERSAAAEAAAVAAPAAKPSAAEAPDVAPAAPTTERGTVARPRPRAAQAPPATADPAATLVSPETAEEAAMPISPSRSTHSRRLIFREQRGSDMGMKVDTEMPMSPPMSARSRAILVGTAGAPNNWEPAASNFVSSKKELKMLLASQGSTPGPGRPERRPPQLGPSAMEMDLSGDRPSRSSPNPAFSAAGMSQVQGASFLPTIHKKSGVTPESPSKTSSLRFAGAGIIGGARMWDSSVRR